MGMDTRKGGNFKGLVLDAMHISFSHNLLAGTQEHGLNNKLHP